MKPVLPSMLALALAAAPAFAGKRIQFEVTDLATNKVSPTEVLFDADRMKVDSGDSVVMFLTKGGNRLVMLNKKTNTYQEMDQAYMDQLGQQVGAMNAQMNAALKGLPPAQQAQMEAMMAQMMKGKMGGAAPATATTTYTAKGSGNVNGFACTNYDGMKGTAKVSEVCAAQASAIKLSPSDFQVLDKFRQFFASLTANMPQGIGQLVPRDGMMEPGINGFPVSTTFFDNGKATRREQVKAVTDVSPTDADFSTGTAKKQEMPQMGAPTKGKAK